MAKKPIRKKPQKPLTENQREAATSGLLMAEAASRIKAQDCAAYSVLCFNRGEAPEEWQKLGVEALSKFAEFGWAAFHAMSGLSIDWDKAAENILAKLKQLPKKTR